MDHTQLCADRLAIRPMDNVERQASKTREEANRANEEKRSQGRS
mgnify:CR=1 FL=1